MHAIILHYCNYSEESEAVKRFLFMGVLLAAFLIGCSNEKAGADDKEVKALVNNYLSALEKKDISSAVKYAEDLRFPDKQIQEKEYREIFALQSVTDTKIKELKKVKEGSYEVIVEVIEDGEKGTYTFPVEQTKNEWKLTVGQDIYPEADAR